MSSEANSTGVSSQTLDDNVSNATHAILNKFLVATISLGLLTSAVVVWRDFVAGWTLLNSGTNFLVVGIPALAWFCRKRLTIRRKSLALFAAFLLTGAKNFFLFGPHSIGIMFLGLCCIMLIISFSSKETVIIACAISVVIPLRAVLHFSGIFPIDAEFKNLLEFPASWLGAYAAYFLAVFIVVLGIGQLWRELNKNFDLLKKTVIQLEAANRKLTAEIALKNEYEENLLTTTRKFQSLFEGSRDGVLLLNNNARIVEANTAAVEMSGYSLSELKNVNIFDLVMESDKPNAIQLFEKNLAGELTDGLTEIRITTKAGKVIPVEINSNLILSDDEVMVLSTVRDISYRKQAEYATFNAALEAEEKERERFSKDLHDDLGPVFSSLNLYLQTLNKKEVDPFKKEILHNLSSIVDSAVKQVREISHNLSPYLLREAGLTEAIQHHLRKFSVNGMQTHLDVYKTSTSIPINIETVLYRVFLELLNNTIKHAGATQIDITLSASPKEIIFKYTDNGKGFDPEEHEQKRGIGLTNLNNRIRALGGTLTFQRRELHMTALVNIPL